MKRAAVVLGRPFGQESRPRRGDTRDSFGVVVALTLKTSTTPEPDFLRLPWSTPLEAWPDELAVRLPRGRHRHVVRFIEHESSFFACKEISAELAHREYRLLEHLKEVGLPVVDLVGVADQRTDEDGNELDAVLITRHLTYSLPYLHLFAGQSGDAQLHDRLVDALAILLARIHLIGFYWGDCSLGNALFRRDAGALIAYIVDVETGELHNRLSDGQRQHDLTIATENIVGGLFELEAMGKLDPATDPIEVVERLQIRYDALWNELTGTDELNPDELWRIRERLRRLNDLGFDTGEVEIVERDNGSRVMFRPRIVEEGHHRRQLEQLTGIDAEENQARRLLSAMRSFGAWASREAGREMPEAVVAYRWLTENYEPTIASVPEGLRGKLVDAEIYHQVLDHLWFLSEKAGNDVGLEVATQNYVETVLSVQPDERVVIDTANAVEPTD